MTGSLWTRLTCDHGPVRHTGGQLCVLQACRLAGAGWTHWASDRWAASVWLVLWIHWTSLVCSPPPQLWLHAPHSPTDQLGWHNINRLSQQAAPKSLVFRRPLGIHKWYARCVRHTFRSVPLLSERLHFYKSSSILENIQHVGQKCMFCCSLTTLQVILLKIKTQLSVTVAKLQPLNTNDLWHAGLALS